MKKKVNINGRKYQVEFVTLAVPAKYGDKKIPLVETKCVIRTPRNNVVSEGTSRQNYRDELNWGQGRKFALARALKKFKKKETRAAFWNTYKAEYPVKG